LLALPLLVNESLAGPGAIDFGYWETVDANNQTSRFEYDQLGRRVKRTLPAGQFEVFSYDNGGNLTSRADFNGRTTTFAYDMMRRLLSRTPDPSLSQPAVSFTYNSTGQRATMADASGATTYTYDVRNRLTSKQTPFGPSSGSKHQKLDANPLKDL
jgi:YD repeat-containing protein